MSAELRQDITEMVEQMPSSRWTQVLTALGIATSSWYRPPVADAERRRPGPEPKAVDPEVAETVVKMATDNPWYGYKRIAVMCRRIPKLDAMMAQEAA